MADTPASIDVPTPSPVPENDTAQPPPRKRQLFKNRPAWSSQSATTKNLTNTENGKEDEGDALRAFSRAKDTFRLIQEDEERAKQQKVKEREEAEKKEQEKKRKIEERTIAMYAKITQNFTPVRKKRKISAEAEDSDLGGASDVDETVEGVVHRDYKIDVASTGLATPPRSRSVRSSATPRSSVKKRLGNGVVDRLDDDEPTVRTPSRKSRSAALHNDAERDDALQRLSSPTPVQSHAQALVIDDSDDNDNPPRSQIQHQNELLSTSRPPTISRTPSAHQATSQPPRPPAPNPILSLLIHSPLPNTTPLLVKRRLQQRLKEVRLAWINKQRASSSLTNSEFPADHKIFLTWRGKKCFDFTSCASLGLAVDEITGEVMVKRKDSDSAGGNMGPGASGMSAAEEREWRESLADDGGAQLVLEAVTDEILAGRKKAVDRKAEVVSSGLSTSTQAGSSTQVDPNAGSEHDFGTTRLQPSREESQPQTGQRSQADEETSAVEPKIKIILRAGREYEDYKLQVRPVSCPFFSPLFPHILRIFLEFFNLHIRPPTRRVYRNAVKEKKTIFANNASASSQQQHQKSRTHSANAST